MSDDILLLVFLGSIISIIISYWLIRSAVKAALSEVRKESEVTNMLLRGILQKLDTLVENDTSRKDDKL